MIYANVVVFMGNLTKDPRRRDTPSEKVITDLIVAANRKSGTADYIPVIVWGEDAEAAARYLKKGSLVHIVGRLQTRNYERVLRHPVTSDPIKWTGGSAPSGKDYRVDSDGTIYTKHVAVEVVAVEIEFLDKLKVRPVAQPRTAVEGVSVEAALPAARWLRHDSL